MNKVSPPSSLKNLDFNEDWSHSPFVEWLSAYKKFILWAFIGLLTLLILAYRLTAARTLNAEADFFRAQTLFTQFQQASVSSENPSTSDFEQLNTILQRHPELKAKYQGPLAQTLLIIGEANSARPLAEDIFKRTQPDQLQLYQDYSKASLLIGEGLYSEALQRSQQLKNLLDQTEQEAAHSTLYLFNLIRLALLYQQLNQPQEELQLWNQLQNQPKETLMVIDQAFKMGQVSLNQYVEERQKALAEKTDR